MKAKLLLFCSMVALIMVSCKPEQDVPMYIEVLKVSDVILADNTTQANISLGVETKNLSMSIVDSVTNVTPTWCRLELRGNIIYIHADRNTDFNERVAIVSLFVLQNETKVQGPTFKIRQLRKSQVLLDSEELSTDYPSDTLTVSMKANIEYNLMSLTDWLTVLSDSTTDGETHTITVKVEANETDSIRHGQIGFFHSLYGKLATVTITQGCQWMELKTYDITLSHDAGYFDIPFTTNTEYDAVVDNADWIITPNSDSRYASFARMFSYVPEKTGSLRYYAVRNATDSIRHASISITAKSGGFLLGKVNITQNTNPEITLEQKKYTVNKEGSSISIPLQTLTPYTVSISAPWVVDKGSQKHKMGVYTNDLNIRSFNDRDTYRSTWVVFRNDYNQADSVLIEQWKYFYLESTSEDMMVGDIRTMGFVNISENKVTWKSSNTDVATVSDNGTVKAIGRGTVSITASIGAYDNIRNYEDVCKLKVIGVQDKVTVNRGYGSYQNENGYITADCELVITNEYEQTVDLQYVDLVDKYQNVYNTMEFGYSLAPGKSTGKFKFELERIYQPMLNIYFSCGGKNYCAQWNY